MGTSRTVPSSAFSASVSGANHFFLPRCFLLPGLASAIAASIALPYPIQNRESELSDSVHLRA